MSIRIRVTLEDDIVEKLKAESLARGTSFRELLNDLLRLALTAPGNESARPGFRVKPFHMGYRQGLNHDNLESLTEFGEGGGHR